MKLNEWLNNPRKDNSISYRVNKIRQPIIKRLRIKVTTTGEEEFLEEIERFDKYLDKRKLPMTLKDYVNYAENVFKKDVSLHNLYRNMSYSTFKTGITKLYQNYIKDNYLILDKILKKVQHTIKGKTKKYRGVEFNKFNVIFTKKGMRFINKQNGRFIKKPQPSDFI